MLDISSATSKQAYLISKKSKKIFSNFLDFAYITVMLDNKFLIHLEHLLSGKESWGSLYF